LPGGKIVYRRQEKHHADEKAGDRPYKKPQEETPHGTPAAVAEQLPVGDVIIDGDEQFGDRDECGEEEAYKYERTHEYLDKDAFGKRVPWVTGREAEEDFVGRGSKLIPRIWFTIA
jgi:hypothetical protein